MYRLVLLVLLVPYAASLTLNSSVLYQLKELHDEIERDRTYYKIQSKKLQVDIDRLALNVHTLEDLEGTSVGFLNASKIADLTPFNTSVKTVVYTHGWIEKTNEKGSLVVRNAILNASDYNIILVDWDYCAYTINYLASWGCVEDVGYYLGQALLDIQKAYNYPLDNFVLVGHSLGAHISGYAGKYTNGSIAVIVGLDPAGPLFFKELDQYRLTKNDAKYVQAIHTCSAFLGVNYDMAVADFWPNPGPFWQNGCKFDITGACSHNRAYEYYAESVVLNNFYGRKCDSSDQFRNGDCDRNGQSEMGGLDVNTTVFGNYYLTTNDKSPYGKGKL